MRNPSFVEENEAARVELSQLISQLDEHSFRAPVGSGWTISTALCHLAFWDQRVLFLLREWEGSEKIETSRLSSQSIDSINQAVNAIALAVPGPAAGRLALDGAVAVDSHLTKISDEFAEALVSAGFERYLRRSLHRREQIQKIRQVLERRPSGESPA